MRKNLHYLVMVVITVPLVYLAMAWNQLPETVPTHFGINGQPDDHGSKWTLLIFTPISVGLYLVLRFLPQMDPKLKNQNLSEHYPKLILLILTFLSAVHVLVIHAAIEQIAGELFMNLVFVGVFLLFAGLGNYLNNIKPNYFVGIRTPWTLESGSVWRKTHQKGAKLFFVVGIVGALVVVWLPITWKVAWTLALTLGVSLWVVIYSYRVYQKEKSANTLLLLLLCLSGVTIGYTQTTYEGTLATLKFGLTSNLQAQSVQIYIPEQGLFGYEITAPVFRNDSLIATLKSFNTVLSGKLTEDTFTGQWKQNGFPASVLLKKVEKLSFLDRPQQPQAPFSYQSEDVQFKNDNQSITFGGTFTFPNGQSTFPTVILITGSGQQDRDETLFGHKPFWVIADHLSRNGFGVLRIDDRGIGQTTGKVGTSVDYAQDVLAAIQYLKTRKEVNSKKIGLIGHSEGGMIASMVATQSKDVAFMVSLAGLGVNGTELLLQQNDDLLKQSNVGDTYRSYFRELNALVYSKISSLTPTDDVSDSLEVVFENWKQRQPEGRLGQLGFVGEIGKKKFLQSYKPLTTPWYRYFLAYDPQFYLSRIKIPVLALNGSKDIQVAAQANLAGFEKGLTVAGNKNFKTVVLPELNHLFQKCQKCTVAEYGMLSETFSVEVLAIMTNWLKAQ